jgi:hypothetical protein
MTQWCTHSMVEASFDAGVQGVHVLDHVVGATLALALKSSASGTRCGLGQHG